MNEKKDKLDLLLNKYFNAKKEKMLTINESSVQYDASAYVENSEIEELCETPEPCPAQDVILAYLDGMMNADEKSVFEKHVKRCRNCGSIVRSGKKLLSEYAEGKLPAAPKDLSQEIASKLGHIYRKAKSRKKNK